MLLLGGKDVHHAVDSLRRVIGVKGGQDKVTGFGDRDRRRDGLEVPHLADEQDVGRLAEGRPECVCERGDIRADLALLDNTALVPVDVLDRVLDGDHVARPGRHDVVHHRRQRGGFARAGGPGHQDQTLAQPGQAAHHRGHAKLIEVRDLIRDESQRQANGSALLEGVDPKPRPPFPIEGEVEIALCLKAGPALGRHHFPRHLLDLVWAKRIARDWYQGAILAHGGRRSGRQYEIGGRLVQQDLEVGVDDQRVRVRLLAGRRA